MRPIEQLVATGKLLITPCEGIGIRRNIGLVPPQKNQCRQLLYAAFGRKKGHKSTEQITRIYRARYAIIGCLKNTA